MGPMKKITAALAIATLLFTAGCGDDYFADGGLLDDQVGVLDVSTMDYLESNPEAFGTLVGLIKRCQLEDAVNKSGNTFLAPQDYSIFNYFALEFPNPNERPASLAEIPQENLDKISEIIKNYLIPGEEIVREKLSTAYHYTTTLGNKKARFNLIREDYLGNVNMGAASIVFSLDTSLEGQKEQYQTVEVVTSNLRSTNGIIHVLKSDAHIFGFN